MSQQINLFNPLFLKKKNYLSVARMQQGLVLVSLCSALWIAYAHYRSSLLDKEAAAMVGKVAAAQADLARIEASAAGRSKSAALETDVKKTEAEVRSLQRVFDILQKGDLGNREGYSEYFRAFAQQIVPGLWLTGLSVNGAGTEMTIQGRALRPELVPEYLGRLKRESTMQGKSFATLDMAAPPAEKNARSPYIEFSLQSVTNTRENTPNPSQVEEKPTPLQNMTKALEGTSTGAQGK